MELWKKGMSPMFVVTILVLMALFGLGYIMYQQYVVPLQDIEVSEVPKENLEPTQSAGNIELINGYSGAPGRLE